MPEVFRLVSTLLAGQSIALDTTQTTYLKTTASSGLEWTAPAANKVGQIKLCTEWTGTAYCLDILNDDAFANPSRTIPQLAQPATLTGQTWNLIQIGDSFRLSNAFTGPGWYLDVSDSGKVSMNNATGAGTLWKYGTSSPNAGSTASKSTTLSNGGSIFTTSTSSIVTSSNLATSAVSAALLTPTTETRLPNTTAVASTQNDRDFLSAGAKAGIGCGAVLGLVILFALYWTWTIRRSRRTGTAVLPMVDDKRRRMCEADRPTNQSDHPFLGPFEMSPNAHVYEANTPDKPSTELETRAPMVAELQGSYHNK